MIRATKRRTMSVLRTPQAVALICSGAVCFTALLLFAPPEVREWLTGGAALGAVTTIAGLFVQLRAASQPAPDARETLPPGES